MARSLSIRVHVSHDPVTHAPIGWYVHFEHWNTADSHAKIRGEHSVTHAVTSTEAYQGTGGVTDDIVADCKAFVTNTGAHAGEGNYDGDYDAETWSN